MNKLKLVFKGRIPSKKNSKRIVMRGKRPLLLSSAEHVQWHSEQSYELNKQIAGLNLPIKDIKDLTLEFYAPDFRSADLTNKAESIMDLLVDKKIIEDDNWFKVPSISLKMIKVDKNDPRCEVGIVV